jgi:hypothetical protein
MRTPMEAATTLVMMMPTGMGGAPAVTGGAAVIATTRMIGMIVGAAVGGVETMIGGGAVSTMGAVRVITTRVHAGRTHCAADPLAVVGAAAAASP